MAMIRMTRDGKKGVYNTETKEFIPEGRAPVIEECPVHGGNAATETANRMEEPAPRIQVQWKGQPRCILTSSDDPLLAGAPHRRATRWLVKKLLELVELPRVPPYGYVRNFGKDALDTNCAAKTFAPLGDIQRWCRSKNLFDLSALIVGEKTKVPGSGYYVSDTLNTDEWRKYMASAVQALREARTRGMI